MESHARDHEKYVDVSLTRKRRAKALLGKIFASQVNRWAELNDAISDFERHDDDELGFRKNDIITVISQKDEHCWVGELNGLQGTLIDYNLLFEDL